MIVPLMIKKQKLFQKYINLNKEEIFSFDIISMVACQADFEVFCFCFFFIHTLICYLSPP